LHCHIIRASLGASFTHPIAVSSAASVAGGINILSWIVRLCRNQHVISVDIDVGRGGPLPAEAHRIYSPHPFVLGRELGRSRCRRRRGRPGLRAVSPTGDEAAAKSSSSPDDHFTASPHCRVIESCGRRVGRGGGRPTIRAGIVSPAGVQDNEVLILSPADDHFTTSQHCCVI